MPEASTVVTVASNAAVNVKPSPPVTESEEAPLSANVVSVFAAEILLIVADSKTPVAESSVIATSAPAEAPANSIVIESLVPVTGPAFKFTVNQF